MEKTIEQKAAEAVLQREAPIEIGGETYLMPPPSVATLILASEIISTLPTVEKPAGRDPGAVVNTVLATAKDFKALGELAAVLVLGAKRLAHPQSPWERLLRALGRRDRRKERLGRLILEEMGPSALWDLVLQRLNALEIGDFFAITTSLSEANLLRATREVAG